MNSHVGGGKKTENVNQKLNRFEHSSERNAKRAVVTVIITRSESLTRWLTAVNLYSLIIAESKQVYTIFSNLKFQKFRSKKVQPFDWSSLQPPIPCQKAPIPIFGHLMDIFRHNVIRHNLYIFTKTKNRAILHSETIIPWIMLTSKTVHIFVLINNIK